MYPLLLEEFCKQVMLVPWREQQVTDIRRRQKRGMSGTMDELAVVMHKAYLEDSNKCFIKLSESQL